MGTKEFKDILICNGQGMVAGYHVNCLQDGKWFVGNDKHGFVSSKLDIILDWLVNEGVLDETRFRLTSAQKSILRTRMFGWIGCGIELLLIELVVVIIIIQYL
jgi:hypothetical protein